MNDTDIKANESLFETQSDASPPQSIDILLEQYKIIVQSSEDLVRRRLAVNTFFVTVNSIVLASPGLIRESEQNNKFSVGLVVLGIVGILICIAWNGLVKSYRQLNRGKFVVIHALENKLPAAVFRAEWIALGQGKYKSIYKPFTATESSLSKIFSLLYAAMIIWGLENVFGVFGFLRVVLISGWTV